jgi:hypothetical protein
MSGTPPSGTCPNGPSIGSSGPQEESATESQPKIMARSTVVYVVMLNRLVLAGFTVKHELVSWLGRQPDTHAFRIWRAQDGVSKSREPTDITKEILDAVD